MNSTIYFGRYIIPDGFKPQHELIIFAPIEWQIVSVTEDEMVLISKNVLDWEAYDYRVPTYENSNLMQAVDDLVKTGFNTEEQACIRSVTVPSLTDINSMDINMRRAVMPFVDIVDGSTVISYEFSEYWLRDAGKFDDEAAIINQVGEVDFQCIEADEIGIRLMMTVDKKKAMKIHVEGGYNPWHPFNTELY